MNTVVKITNEEDSEYHGIFISKQENVKKVMGDNVAVGDSFKFLKFDYEVLKISFRTIPTTQVGAVDDDLFKADTVITLFCKSSDERLNQELGIVDDARGYFE